MVNFLLWHYVDSSALATAAVSVLCIGVFTIAALLVMAAVTIVFLGRTSTCYGSDEAFTAAFVVSIIVAAFLVNTDFATRSLIYIWLSYIN